MIHEILLKEGLNKNDITSLLQIEDNFDVTSLFEKADEVRKKYCGNDVHLRGIIEISNYCEQNCVYCGLRLNNKSLQRYRLNLDEILTAALAIREAGIQTIVIQSGEDFKITTDEVAEIILKIQNTTGAAITLSLGERSFEDYKIWKDAGADRYLLKHETANPNLYTKLHSGQKLDERIEHLRRLKSLGYQVGSGNMVGLPGQSLEDIADDIILCKELDVDMASFSPFLSSPDTPYKNKQSANLALVLKTLAVARIVLKNVHMPATTALAALHKDGYEKGLLAGANVIMPNFTPKGYKEKYLIYPNKNRVDKETSVQLESIRNLTTSLGRNISATYGHSLKQFVNR